MWQLIFVFDGPSKPYKEGRANRHYSASNVQLLKILLDQLGVPRHDAPGEAEAECVKLQELGVVDAVWSDDSDNFLFGCNTLVQFHKPEGQEFKSEDNVLVYTANVVAEKLGLAKKGFLMYAILVGYDYGNGLPDFGPAKLLKIAKHDAFQAAAELLSAHISETRELNKWRALLTRMVRETWPNIDFTCPPSTFPNLRVLESCSRPKVSSGAQLRSLEDRWFRPFGPGMRLRYEFLLSHFNSRMTKDWPAEYLVAIELNERLRRIPEGRIRDNLQYYITEKTAVGSRKEATIIVDPLLVIPELLTEFPLTWCNPYTGKPPEFKEVKVTLLDCVLKHGLPDLTEKITKKTSRGRPRKSVATSRKAAVNQAELQKATTNTRGVSGGAPAIFPDERNNENVWPSGIGKEWSSKRQKMGLSSLGDVPVIDLTEGD
ncbi:hypothetical protein F5B20DRAFT_594083 [Whalleya microplaca]|nr:hypothetical protein F5B20DRAFT_594083 [Whalleya microplaca]